MKVSVVDKWTRYETVGDWFYKDGELQIEVLNCIDQRSTFLVGIHEIIEATLCEWDGVPEQVVTDFDTDYKGEGDPGDDETAPYHKQHVIATMVENFLCQLMEYKWEDHDRRIREALEKAS